jgi:hypothetical protein
MYRPFETALAVASFKRKQDQMPRRLRPALTGTLTLALLAAPAVAAAEPGWHLYPGQAPGQVVNYGSGGDPLLGRDGTARVPLVDMGRHDGDARTPLVATRPTGGPWALTPQTPATPPPFASSWFLQRTPEGRALAVATEDGALRAALGEGNRWEAPVVLAEGAVYGQAALGAGGHGLVVWQKGDELRAASLAPGRSAAPAASLGRRRGPSSDFAALAVNEAGDAVVAWIAGFDRTRVVRAAVRPARGSWSAPVTVSGRAARISGVRVTIDPQGRAIILWGQNGGVRVSERAAGAGRWTAPRQIGSGVVAFGAAVATDGAGGALASWTASGGGGVRVAARTPGGRWRPQAAPRLGVVTALTVSPLGDALIVGNNPFTRGPRVWSRPAGESAWVPAPAAVVERDVYGFGGIAVAGNVAGDFVVRWQESVSNTVFPVSVAAYEAAARPGVRALRVGAARAGRLGKTRVLLRLSAPGRALVQVRRGAAGPIVGAYMTTAGLTTSPGAFPRAVQRALARPGRYVLSVETGARSVHRGTREMSFSVEPSS